MLRRIALFVSLLIPLAHAPAGDEKKPAEHYPLQVGNTWECDMNVAGKKSTMTSKIARVEVIDGIPLTVLEAEMNGQIIATEHLRIAEKGIYRHRSNQFIPDPPLLLLKTPLKADDKWAGEFKVGNTAVKYTTETKDEDVEVPAGKFKTIRVDIRIEENNQVVTTCYWFAPNVGYVKQTVHLGPVQILAELRKYEVQKAK